MAEKDQQHKTKSPLKRKEVPGAKYRSSTSITKKPRLVHSKPSSKPLSNDSKSKKPFKKSQPGHENEKKAPMSKLEHRKNAKKPKRKFFVKPNVKKNQANVDHITGDKIPKSFVFARAKLPGVLKQLQMDLRKLMLPYTALNLREKKRNGIKDFLNVAGPMGVTHFLILSKTQSAPYLRVARTPQGPTLTFKINDYSLATDVAKSQLRPRCPQDLFKDPPLIVLSGFGTGDQHLKLTTIMFQNIFPAIDVNTVKLSSCRRIVLLNYNKDTKLIDFKHYSIRLQPVGVSRRIRKFVQKHHVPDLSNLQDVSDFITKAGYGSESEADDEAATVTLASDLGRINRASKKSAVKLQEIGPRMTLQLIKIEEGLCSGGVIFSEYGNGDGKKEHEDKENEDDDDDYDDDDSERAIR